MKESNIAIQNSKGFALIVVMIISFLGSLIVFDTMKENVNQERMAGNYSKELNARIQAENGLASAYNTLSANSGMTSDVMMTNLNNTQSSSGEYRYQLGAWTPTSSTLTANDVSIKSDGAHYEGNYTMHASMSLTSAGGNNVFTGAITTCDGASLGGSGKIDSYDSSQGAYGGSNIGNEGDVSVLNEDASGLNLTGGSKINGDLSINGNLSVTNGIVTGNAHVTGNLTTSNSGAASISDSIQATGNVDYLSTSTTFPDSISANGNVAIGESDYDNSISYSGTLDSKRPLTNAVYYEAHQVQPVGTEECDILDLASEFGNTTDGVGTLATITPTNINVGYPTNKYILSDSGIIAYNETWDVKAWENVNPATETIDFLGNETPVYILDIDGFGDASLTLTIESGSDVTIYLSGDTALNGSIIVEDGASLTILTKDKVSMGSNGSITSSTAVNSTGEISTILYSDYDSSNNYDYGVSLAGGSSSTLAVYAPQATMNVTAGGDIYGSLRSDYLKVTGGAGIHFDEKIPTTTIKEDASSNQKITINRWL